MAARLRLDGPLPVHSAYSIADLDTLQRGIIYPLLFGWVAPVRPQMIWSLQTPTYEVRPLVSHAFI